MLGKGLIAGIVVPATCGIFGWEGKDHHAPRERLEPLKVLRGIVLGEKFSPMPFKDAKEALLVDAIYPGIFDLEIRDYIHGNI
jgi:hypothetical protein